MLFAIAYRILGSVAEAEDAVRVLDAARGLADPAKPRRPTAAVVTRISIDVLRSARVRRETYVGGSRSRCSTTRTRTRNGRRSWRTRCRWPPCCCSSG